MTLIHKLSSRRRAREVEAADSPVMAWSGMGSNPAGDLYFYFDFFYPSLFRGALDPMQMKSSMTIHLQLELF